MNVFFYNEQEHSRYTSTCLFATGLNITSLMKELCRAGIIDSNKKLYVASAACGRLKPEETVNQTIWMDYNIWNDRLDYDSRMYRLPNIRLGKARNRNYSIFFNSTCDSGTRCNYYHIRLHNFYERMFFALDLTEYEAGNA